MTTINLKNFYSWYTQDEYIEVPDAVAEELLADQRYEKSHRQRLRRNKAFYSLDVGDDIEAEVCFAALSPQQECERQERRCRLCQALNSLPASQGLRIEAHYILGISKSEIARSEGSDESSVRESITRGLEAMKKDLKNSI